MTIVFDVRSLEESEGGIPHYTRSLIKAFQLEDKDDTLVMFTNSFRVASARNVINFGMPNKILDASFFLRGKPYVDKKIEQKIGKKVDLIFMPNMNFIAMSEEARLVVVAHDLSYEHYPQFLSLKSRQWHTLVRPRNLFHKAHRIIAVSEYTKKDLMRTYEVQGEKIHVVHHGIDSQFFTTPTKSREQLKLPRRYFLAVGMGSERKNIPLLLAAYQELRNNSSYHDVPLLITGVHSRHSPNISSIQYLGYPSKEEYHALLSHAEALVYPSLFEGFGLPVVEAFACGTPVIASAHSSIAEIGANAFYPIDPYNVSSLAKAMLDILTMPTLKQRLIEEGKKRAALFSWEQCARKTREVFKKALSQDL